MNEAERAEWLIAKVTKIICGHPWCCLGRRPRNYKQWARNLAEVILGEMVRDHLIVVPEQMDYLRKIMDEYREQSRKPKPSDN